jgi:hypothetical protein
LKIGGLDIVFPNWLFQALGLTAQDLRSRRSGSRFPRTGHR